MILFVSTYSIPGWYEFQPGIYLINYREDRLNMPITFNELTNLRTITLFEYDNFEATALITKCDKKYRSQSLIYMIYITIGMAAIIIAWLNAILSAMKNTSVIYTIVVVILAITLCKDMIRRACIKDTLSAMSAYYSIELYEVHDNKCTKTIIYITEDGFYDSKYNYIVAKIFDIADSIYNKSNESETISPDILLED